MVENTEGIWSEEAIRELEGTEESTVETPEAYVPAAEAVLFTLGRAVSPAELAKALFCSTSTAMKAVRLLQEEYGKRESGLMIREFDGRVQMCTNPGYYENLIRLVSAPKKPVLTDVVMETLAIIAYRSPVTKVDIEKIRGVSSDHAVNKLIEYGLVEETGRLDAVGRPALFSVTEEFYRRFGYAGKEEFPSLSADRQRIIEEEAEEEAENPAKEQKERTQP